MNSLYGSESATVLEANPSYGDLYIYYLEGRMPDISGCCSRHFIGNWEEDGFSFLFFSQPSDGEVLKIIETYGGLKFLDSYRMSYEEWQGGTFSSFRIGGFSVVPPWEERNARVADQETINVLLDPGVVFGNGLHPTTQDCIKAVELVCSSEFIESALDLGCGTGILSLAAAKSGCRKCLALDFNFLASQTALKNVKMNGLMDNILVVRAKAEHYVDLPVDLLMANIHYDVMKRLLESEGFFNKRWFILSGLLRSQADDISDRLRRPGVNIMQKWERDGIWHTFLGKIS